MAETIGQVGQVGVTAYARGKGKGIGVQLTGPDGFVQLSVEESAELAGMLAGFALGHAQRLVDEAKGGNGA